MEYLRQQAPEVMNQLTEQQLIHLRNALIQAQQQHIDPQLHLLYGALDTLQRHTNALLNRPFSLSKLYEQANALQTQQNKTEQYTAYANFLAQNLEIDNTIYISEIQTLLATTAQKQRDTTLKAYFQQHHIAYNPNIIYNAAYLSELDPNKEPLFIADVNVNGEAFQLVSLITKKQMEEESKQLNHCVGKSNFYIEKVRDNKILVLSLRDTAGN
ncbi:MAG: hypothetical protein LBP53_04950, partial [Candidatus Peribacteria bacterium]|nr:hypothetical protein [Candidatus Peribacteria bacterium]